MSLQALLGVVRHLVEVAWFLFRLYSEAEQKTRPLHVAMYRNMPPRPNGDTN